MIYMRTYFSKISSLFVAGSAVLLASVSSCQKNEEPAPPPSTVEAKPACKITKSYSVADPGSYWLNQFDQQDNLLNQTYYDDGVVYTALINKHNEKGQIVEQTWEYKDTPNPASRVYNFAYNEKGQVAKITTKYSESLCAYDASGNRTQVTETYTGTGEKRVNTFAYKDGNCIKGVYPGPYGQSTYEYEHYLDQANKMVPFERVNGYLMGQTPNRNMLRKTTLTEKTSNGTTVTSTQYAYEYNDKGFPVKTTLTFVNASGTTTTRVDVSEYVCP
jgi:hypothetical protein